MGQFVTVQTTSPKPFVSTHWQVLQSPTDHFSPIYKKWDIMSVNLSTVVNRKNFTKLPLLQSQRHVC